LEAEDVSQQFGVPGIVREGVVVPQSNQPLPEGMHVEILLEPGELPAALRTEIDAWDKASDESWKWIEALESDEA
jgi:hypothetical protein